MKKYMLLWGNLLSITGISSTLQASDRQDQESPSSSRLTHPHKSQGNDPVATTSKNSSQNPQKKTPNKAQPPQWLMSMIPSHPRSASTETRIKSTESGVWIGGKKMASFPLKESMTIVRNKVVETKKTENLDTATTKK